MHVMKIVEKSLAFVSCLHLRKKSVSESLVHHCEMNDTLTFPKWKIISVNGAHIKLYPLLSNCLFFFVINLLLKDDRCIFFGVALPIAKPLELDRAPLFFFLIHSHRNYWTHVYTEIELNFARALCALEFFECTKKFTLKHDGQSLND